MRLDPSRTTLLRRKFIKEMNERFKKVVIAVRELILDDDALGLVKGQPFEMMQANVEKQAWRFLTDANKVKSFRKWLKQQVNLKVLTVDGVTGKPWTATYVESAYRKGMVRAYVDARRGKLVDTADFYRGTEREFLRSSFMQPEILSKIELIYTRAYNDLEGVTDAMGQKMSRILADGLAQGKSPSVIARNLTNSISKINKTRARVIARTEIIHAHAEGQLDAFELLEIEEVEGQVESSTAGDERVCAECAHLETQGPFKISKARGLIPVHANCRCCWLPVMKKGKKKAVAEKKAKRKVKKKAKPKVKMDIEGVSDKYRSMIEEQTSALVEKFPKAGKRLKAVTLVPTRKYAKYAGNSMASIGKVGKTGESILLNAKYWGKKSRLDVTKVVKRHHRSGMGAEKTARDGITHEFGHIVQSSLPAKGTDRLFDFAWTIEGGPGELGGKNYKLIAKQVSRYAQTNYKEAFAESFAQWQMGEASPTARKILRLGGLKI